MLYNTLAFVVVWIYISVTVMLFNNYFHILTDSIPVMLLVSHVI